MIDKGTSTALKISPFRRSRSILVAKDLRDAIKGCDTFAKAKVVFGPMALGYVGPCMSPRTACSFIVSLLRSARWRKEPATEQQNKFITKRWGKHQLRQDNFDSNGEPLAPERRMATLTKGEAANIITRLKHGAQVLNTFYVSASH